MSGQPHPGWSAQSRANGAIEGRRIVGPTDEAPEILLLTGPGSRPPAAFVEGAAARIGADPRTASVSWTPISSDRESRAPADEVVAFAAAPHGPAVAINLAVTDLLALPGTNGVATQDQWQAWALEANHRGLRHVWLAAASDSASSVDELCLPISTADALELQDDSSALSKHLRSVSPLRPITVAVEAQWLGPYETGAQVVVVEMIAALACRGDIGAIRLCNLPGGEIPDYADRLRGDPKVVVYDPGQHARADVYWRPQQPEMASLTDNDRELGHRIVATVLDLISYSNRRYHGSAEIQAELHHHVRRYLEQLDGITTISGDVAEHVVAEVPGVSSSRVTVTPLGVEHLTRTPAPKRRPAELATLGDDSPPFLLVLGNDFMHKNRDFAVKIWREVTGVRKVDLVLAGLHVGQGSAEEFERPLRAWFPENGSRLHRFESVSSPAKTWLLANADVVLYPTAAEGFGFIPFEAASLGTPSVVTRFGPLAENLPPGVGVASWALADHVAEVLRLLDSDQARTDVVDAINRAAVQLTWDRSAASLVGAFRAALRRPPQPHLAVPWSKGCPICLAPQQASSGVGV